MSQSLNLVTGGAGFIGSHLAHALLARGERVRIVDNFSTGRRENLAGLEGAELITGDLADSAVCARACAGAAFVFHQAALPSVPRSLADPAATHAACATATLNVLIAARAAGVRRVVYAASSSAYGNTPELPKHEGMPARPRSPYAAAKLAGENYCAAFYHGYGLETVALRYFNVFGPRQDPASPYSGVIAVFMSRLLRGEVCTIRGDGETSRDFTYVENVVAANLAARAANAAPGNVYNIGCGERFTLNELYQMIAAAAGSRLEPHYGPEREGDVRDSLADITAARRDLGYHPAVGARAGLERTLAWYRAAAMPAPPPNVTRALTTAAN